MEFKENLKQMRLQNGLTQAQLAEKLFVSRRTGAKWENGAALSLHDFDFVVHECQVTESDYVLSGSGYKAPTCTEDGYCMAKCPVCDNEEKVVLSSEKYGHNVPQSALTVDQAATCSDDGYGHGNCTICNQTIQNVKIPALGKHVYDKEIVYMAAKCGSIGISQIVCAGCGRVGSQAPIPATNVHEHVWTEDYCASYTDAGKEKYACKECGMESNDNGVTEKIIAKKELSKEFLTFIGYSIRTTDFAGIRLTYKEAYEKIAEKVETGVITGNYEECAKEADKLIAYKNGEFVDYDIQEALNMKKDR